MVHSTSGNKNQPRGNVVPQLKQGLSKGAFSIWKLALTPQNFSSAAYTILMKRVIHPLEMNWETCACTQVAKICEAGST